LPGCAVLLEHVAEMGEFFGMVALKKILKIVEIERDLICFRICAT
jgi:hypothetical protein